MDVNASNDIDSADGDPHPETKSAVLTVMKDERQLCSTGALHVKHKDLQKNKDQRKVVTTGRRLLKQRTLQYS